VKSALCPVALVALVSGLCLCACDSKPRAVDASKPLQQSFKSAEAPVQQAIAQATACLQKRNYAEATRALMPVVEAGNLTAPQQQAVALTLQQINQAAANDPSLKTPEMFEMRKKLFNAAFAKPR
jgi:hypothetical protein